MSAFQGYDPERLKQYANDNPGWTHRVNQQALHGFKPDPQNYQINTDQDLQELLNAYDRGEFDQITQIFDFLTQENPK